MELSETEFPDKHLFAFAFKTKKVLLNDETHNDDGMFVWP